MNSKGDVIPFKNTSDICLQSAGIVLYTWNFKTDEIQFNVPLTTIIPEPELKHIKKMADFADFMNQHDIELMQHIPKNAKNDRNFQANEIKLTFPNGMEYWLSNSFILYTEKGNQKNNPIISGTIRNITVEKQKNFHLSYLAHTDELTGLLNRSKLKEKIAIAMASSVKYGYQSAYLVVSIDNLYNINDTFGYDVTDQLIQAVGEKLSDNLRITDLIGRISSGKFGILLVNYNDENLNISANRILQLIRSTIFETQLGYISTTVSIGGTIIPGTAKTTVDIMSNAEEALANAKINGLDSFVQYQPCQAKKSQKMENAQIAREIVLALKENRILLAYQPIVCSKTLKPKFYECLARLKMPDGRILNGGEFIPIAEKIGFIRFIDRRISELAVQALNINPHLRLSINISGYTATDIEWLNNFLYLIKENRNIADRMVVEITETVAISDLEESLKFISNLKTQGCKLAIDDFGAGYTSFSNLKNLDIDIVKIDGSYVKDIHKNKDNEYFVKTLLELAQNFNLETVAEMVSCSEVHKVLNKYDIDYYQGFHFGFPSIQIPYDEEDGNQSKIA